jgi:hypothetical protein
MAVYVPESCSGALNKEPGGATESPIGGDFYSKLIAPHRGMSLGPFVLGPNNETSLRRPLLLAMLYAAVWRNLPEACLPQQRRCLCPTSASPRSGRAQVQRLFSSSWGFRYYCRWGLQLGLVSACTARSRGRPFAALLGFTFFSRLSAFVVANIFAPAAANSHVPEGP